MRVIESGHDAFALKVNHLRLRANPFANLFCGADRDDEIFQTSNGFRFGLLVIHRPDFSVEQNQVGWRLREGGFTQRQNCE